MQFTTQSALTFAAVLCSSSCVLAQPPRGGANKHGENAGARGGMAAHAVPLARGNNQQPQQLGMRQRGAGNQMPSVEQLAQLMITDYDADGDGALNAMELQSALGALRTMMMQRMQTQQAQAITSAGPQGQMQLHSRGGTSNAGAAAEHAAGSQQGRGRMGGRGPGNGGRR